MKRCWLKGAEGDALHALLCAAGSNVKWLMRAIARMGLVRLCFVLSVLAMCAALIGRRHADGGSGAADQLQFASAAST